MTPKDASVADLFYGLRRAAATLFSVSSPPPVPAGRATSPPTGLHLSPLRKRKNPGRLLALLLAAWLAACSTPLEVPVQPAAAPTDPSRSGPPLFLPAGRLPVPGDPAGGHHQRPQGRGFGRRRSLLPGRPTRPLRDLPDQQRRRPAECRPAPRRSPLRANLHRSGLAWAAPFADRGGCRARRAGPGKPETGRAPSGRLARARQGELRRSPFSCSVDGTRSAEPGSRHMSSGVARGAEDAAAAPRVPRFQGLDPGLTPVRIAT
jgi:hypothetical protein